jgi:hypothetical protein
MMQNRTVNSIANHFAATAFPFRHIVQYSPAAPLIHLRLTGVPSLNTIKRSGFIPSKTPFSRRIKARRRLFHRVLNWFSVSAVLYLRALALQVLFAIQP